MMQANPIANDQMTAKVPPKIDNNEGKKNINNVSLSISD